MHIEYCINCLETKNSIFKVLTNEEKDMLAHSANTLEFKKNDFIYKEGYLPSGLMVLAKGKVKIFKDALNGKEQILRLANAGDFIGYRALFAQEPYNASASALDDCIVCLFSKDALYKTIYQNADFALQIIHFFARELGYAESNLVSLTQKHIRGRLAESIIRLAETYGFEDDNVTVKLRVYREDLANLANMTTSNAIKTLYNFKEEKVIDLDGKKIKILDYNKLERISRMG